MAVAACWEHSPEKSTGVRLSLGFLKQVVGIAHPTDYFIAQVQASVSRMLALVAADVGYFNAVAAADTAFTGAASQAAANLYGERGASGGGNRGAFVRCLCDVC